MINGAENNSVGRVSWQAADCGVDRRQLAARPIGINDDHARIEFQFRAEFCSVRPEYDARNADARETRGGDKMFDESKALNGNEGFGLAHASGFAGSENSGREHVDLIALQRGDVGESYGLVR